MFVPAEDRLLVLSLMHGSVESSGFFSLKDLHKITKELPRRLPGFRIEKAGAAE